MAAMSYGAVRTMRRRGGVKVMVRVAASVVVVVAILVVVVVVFGTNAIAVIYVRTSACSAAGTVAVVVGAYVRA